MIELATILVSEVEARVVDLKPIPAKIAGGTVRMIYDDPMWERLTKNAVFVGSKAVTVLDINDVVEIPAEAVAHPGKMLKIGICGTAADGKTMIPTVYANLGQVRPSADPDADPSTNPNLPVWAQLQAEIEQLKQGGTGGGSGGNVDFRVGETLKLENGVLSVNTTNDMEQDNTLPITSAGVFATVGNIEALLKTI